MGHSSIRKRFLFSETDQGNFFQRNNFSHGPAVGSTSRKRTRSLLRMSNSEEDRSENDNNTNRGKRTTKNRREPELSAFDKFVDKVLLLDGSSSGLVESSFPLAIVLLTIITASILTNVISKVLFVGLFLLFSSLALYPSLLPWSIESGDNVSADLPSDEEAEAEETRKFTIYYLSIGYLGSLFLTRLIEPFDSESVGVFQVSDWFFLPVIAIALVLMSGVLSDSGLVSPHFGNEEEEVGLDKDEDDHIALSMSAEQSLMDSWDQKFQRNESSDDHDD